MSREQEAAAPRARAEGLIVERLGDELLVYDEFTHRSHCLNRAAALVWESCDGRATAGEIARGVGGGLNAEAAESLVWLALEDLGRKGLLRERRPRHAPGRISRRELVRKLGVAAVLIPVIATITAPTARAAVSCGGSCNPNAMITGCPPNCYCDPNTSTCVG